MRIRLLDEALQDLKEGFYFYESQEANLGAYFLDSLFSDIDSLLIYAGIHTIYYRIDGNDVMVYAVLDCRRKPAWARKRLKPV